PPSPRHRSARPAPRSRRPSIPPPTRRRSRRTTRDAPPPEPSTDGPGGAPRSFDPTADCTRSFRQFLQPLHRMMIVHPRRPGSRFERSGDLVVLEALLRPKQEDLALEPRQSSELRVDPIFEIARAGLALGIGSVRQLLILDRDHLPSL